ncbi:MAG: cold shock domain-containing protein [Cytophagia bacterium]|nr:cold shock domain-containing protein [Cytophagia bacterium]
MARSQTTFNKKEREKKKLQKRKEKLAKREEKKSNTTDGSLDSMMAYVDEFGNISDTPPDPNAKSKPIKAKDIEIGVPKREEEDLTAERRGRVKFFNDSKGYGFIAQDGSHEQFFVHADNLMQPIQEGNKVSFEIAQGPKGMMAVKVKVLG